MMLKTIFEKPVDRHIEGVIKADDEASLRLEVEEYVLTNEVSKRLQAFLDAYNEYEGANGAWVSGFFGSGKSHLLKMLALLLENRSIEGTPVLDLFLPRCGDDAFLCGSLKRAAAIPSRSILFNIDQKADVISKTQIDALLSVFVKVFDEMCGYYGKQGHIAQFERDLDNRGHYESFKAAYREVSGLAWEQGREQALFESGNIGGAYARVTGAPKESALGILDKYRHEYRVSIEDFARHVFEYIERRGHGFRLNFFVDEVGQFIADNVKLMTNLQTIAESLATKCRGRAWLIVTAQEEMDSVVGEMDKKKGNDFSKIQARFANRMKLTSADVAEVIQKRLLLKNAAGVEALSGVYEAQVNNFKTLFDFADGSQEFRNFRDREHFIGSYPFIPYQFTLFQSCIQALSLHNAFEGRHSSVGERSMLGVFQAVAREISERDVGGLATFDLMFGGIRTALKSQIQQAVTTAEKNLGDPFCVDVLKALFLVKYVKEFKATPRNICVLMTGGFGGDMEALRKAVRGALDTLESQTYIQRNGEVYEFLTSEERDIEAEIKNTHVEEGDVAEELAKIVFDHTIKGNKIRFEENGQDYPFTRKLDQRVMGREHELTIHVVSPFHAHYDKVDSLQAQAMMNDELLVYLPPDDRLVGDILMFKRTDKYVRQHSSKTQREAVQRILTNKSFLNREREIELRQRVSVLLAKAVLYVSGYEVEAGGEDAGARIQTGFFELIRRTYPNLKMLRGITYTENDIAVCLDGSRLFGGDGIEISEAEADMAAFIQTGNQGGFRTTVKGLMERYERKPYGWYPAAVLCILAKLCARGKTDVREDGNILENHLLESALKNSKRHANLVLVPQRVFDASKLRGLKTFYGNFFDEPPRSGEPKGLGRETADAFGKLVRELEQVEKEAMQFPFASTFHRALERVKAMEGKAYDFYFDLPGRDGEELMGLKESVLDPVRVFMSGSKRELYEDALRFQQVHHANFSYVEGDENREISGILSDDGCFKGNRMRELKGLVDGLRAKVVEQARRETESAVASVRALGEKLTGMSEFAALPADRGNEIKRAVERVIDDIGKQVLIAVIRDKRRRFEDEEYPALLGRMREWTRSEPTVGTVEEYISIRSVSVEYPGVLLENESDVDGYLAALRAAVMKAIADGKRVQV